MNAFLTISENYSRAKSSLRVTAYENEIGTPTSARSTRKAKTAYLRPRFLAVDVILEGMDDFIIQFARNADGSMNQVGQLLVDGYLNACSIGGSSGGEEGEGGGEGGGTTPPPENPPASNPCTRAIANEQIR